MVILLQAQVLVDTNFHELLKHGAHVLSVACHEGPPRMVGQKCGVTDGGQACTPHRVVPSQMGNNATAVSSRPGTWNSQNSVRVQWAAVSKVSSTSSPVAMVNQAIKLGAEG
jgi:hypothetical protein